MEPEQDGKERQSKKRSFYEFMASFNQALSIQTEPDTRRRKTMPPQIYSYKKAQA